jgi:membrane-bound lytic murein transglycosylase D
MLPQNLRRLHAAVGPSPKTRRISSPVVLLLFPALICLLPGCASGPGRGASEPDYYGPRTVSAREYGYVRPATDVEVIGRGNRTAYGGRHSSDLWDRIRRGPSLGIRHHPRIERAARKMASNPNYLNDLNRRAGPYLHMIVDELERAGLPAELALLPEIESRYNPRAVSPKAASGMWQFMPYTGREMGLKQNGVYDARNDPLAATRGAIAYLSQLHDEMGGDWALALASYNCGPGCVRRAMRAHGSRDFWQLSRLPAETENYVPKLLAVLALVNAPERYGLRMPQLPNRPALELVHASSSISLSEVAQHSGVSMSRLKDLNPGYKLGRTPVTGPHRVLVPAGTGHKLRKGLVKSGKLSRADLADSRRRMRRGDS